MTDYQFHAILDGAYPWVPYSGKRKSNYVDLTNEHYDSALGQRVLEDQLETAIALEHLGFDGVIVSEQHNGPIGVLGNPMLAGAYIAGRTSRLRIGVIGSIINDYLTPVRLAEEIATVDTMTRGRLDFGLPMGHGMQHHSTGVMNPAKTRARFREAHDLLIAAMTRPGPFEWQGDFFHVPYVNLWPKPLQKPHPPIVVPGGGSLETLQLVAEHGYGYQAVLSTREQIAKTFAKLRVMCDEAGKPAHPQQFAMMINVHVAETDRQARQEVEAHELWTYQNFFRSAMHDNFPAGYVSAESLRGILAGGYRSKPLQELGYDELLEMGWLAAGSPETVARQLTETLEQLGTERIVLAPNSGSKPRWLAMKSLTMFAEEVIPRMRPGRAGDNRHAWTTNAEFGARRPEDHPVPTANGLIDGALVRVDTAHVEELREPVEPWPPSDDV